MSDLSSVSLQALLQETTVLKDVLLQRVVALAQHVIDRDATIAGLIKERDGLQLELDQLRADFARDAADGE